MVLWAYWEISVFCSVLGALPLFYISAWLLAHIGITSFSMQVIVTALLFLTPSLAYLYYGYSFRCPRCGQRFLGVMLASRSLPPDTCVHCGLKRDEVPEEILTRL